MPLNAVWGLSADTVWELSGKVVPRLYCTEIVCESGAPDTARPEPDTLADTLADRCIDNDYNERQGVIDPYCYYADPMVHVPDPNVQIEGGQVHIPSTQMASQHKHLHVCLEQLRT